MVYAYRNNEDELVCGSHGGGDLTPVKNKKKARGVCAICGAAIGRMWALAFSDTWERTYFLRKKDAISEGILTMEYLELEEFDEKVKEFKKYGLVDLGNVVMYIEPVDATV